MAITVGTPEDPRQSEADSMLQDLDGTSGLTDWEEEFITNCLEWRGDDKPLGEGQLEKLYEIWGERV